MPQALFDELFAGAAVLLLGFDIVTDLFADAELDGLAVVTLGL
jgi:hypothetical protein